MRKEKDVPLLDKIEKIINGMEKKVIYYNWDGNINYGYEYKYDNLGRVKGEK